MGAFDEFVSKHGDEVRREIHIVEVEQTQSRASVESEAGHKGVGRNADGASEIVGEVLGVIAEGHCLERDAGAVRGKAVGCPVALVALVDIGGQEQDGAIEVGGAKEIYACATHGVLSRPALERIEESPIKELKLCDTIPYPVGEPRLEKINYVSVDRLFAEAIRRIYEEVSISPLFE